MTHDSCLLNHGIYVIQSGISDFTVYFTVVSDDCKMADTIFRKGAGVRVTIKY